MKRPLLCALALTFAGCAMVGPDYQRPQLDLPAIYADEAATGAGMAVPAQWWTLYADPTLDGLIADGMKRSADVRLAVARVEEAEALLREAKATLFFPEIDGQAGATRSRTIRSGLSSTDTSLSLGVATSFEVDLWGRLRRSERAVRDQLLATRHGRDTVALTLAASIARSYFAARSLDSQLTASEEILRAADESLVLAKKRADAGVASALDVYQATTQRATAAAQAKEIARQRAAIVHQLGTLTGRLDVALAPADVALLPIPPLPPAGLPADLLQRRPDVAQAEALLSSASENIGVARGAQFPTLRLTGSAGTQSSELSSLFDPGTQVWSIGAGLIGPIIDGGRYAARTEQAVARARQAEASYQRAVETAFREVADALSNVRLAADAETDLQLSVEQARRALELAQRRYDAGYSAYLEVLDAQRTLNGALLSFIRNRQAYLSFTVDLMNALGGGWQART